MECGHGGMCLQCAELCTKKRPPVCPLCRARIVAVVRVGVPDETREGHRAGRPAGLGHARRRLRAAENPRAFGLACSVQYMCVYVLYYSTVRHA